MEKSRAIELLEHLAWDRDIDRNPYGDAINIAIDALKAQLSQEGTTSDLISRRETIDRFNVIRPVDTKKDEYTKGIDVGIAMCIVVVKDQQTIQSVATDTNVGDTISRQAAIDALDKRFDNIPMQLTEEILMLRKDLRELPTIQPEPQWIPVSERLPEEHEWIGTKKFGTTISDEVYVTFENEKGERFCRHMSFQNGELSRYDQFHMETWFKGSKPIAWMPLPKPFEGELNEMQ